MKLFNFGRKKSRALVATGWESVSLEELRRVSGKDITMIFHDGKSTGRIKVDNKKFLALDGFSFYMPVQVQPGFARTSRIYPIDLEGVNEEDRARGLSIFRNSKGEYTLMGRGVGWFYFPHDLEVEQFMAQPEPDFGYS